MNTSRQIKSDLWYVGGSDRRLALFENMMPIPRGISYNSYLLLDDKTVLLDTADNAVGYQFLENLTSTLQNRTLDYLIIHHVEPDHLALLQEVLIRYPNVKIICSQLAVNLIKQFFNFNLDVQFQTVKEGDTLCSGNHTFTFLAAKMVHWPEVMVSYESEYKILFSADAFGTFGAIDGNLYADEVNFDRDWLDDARRYYTNIVGKYGAQVQILLKKASSLDIEMICPLHGPIWRENLAYYLQKYDLWSQYKPEDKQVLILYGSMYGHTESVATAIAGRIADTKHCTIKMYDVSSTHVSYLVSESFRCSHIVLVAPTYNGGLYPPIENYLLDLKAHSFQGHTFAIAENGSWAPLAGNAIRQIFAEMKPNKLIQNSLTIKSSLKNEQLPLLQAFVNEILEDF